ncbi:MAG: peptidase C69 [Clostridiales bacterium 38-18]|nr:MAG: peptidase C69 [Clostridiales bacterium 38-18]
MLNKQVVKDVLAAAMSTGGDFAEVYVEDRYNNAIEMVSGKVEKSLSGRDYGIGIRIFQGLNSVYTYTCENGSAHLIGVAKKAAAAISGIPKFAGVDFAITPDASKHAVKILPSQVAKKNKIDLMRVGFNSAKSSSALIDQVVVNYMDYTQNVLVANTEGVFAEDQRTRTRYTVSAIANHDGKMQSGSINKGSGKGFELYDEIDVAWIGKESARIALTMLDAKSSPSGKLPVVMDNKFGGVIFHEACGHGLEATSVAKGNSVFADKLGQKIASDVVNAVDDGTVPNEWGSANIDDEGTPTRRNVLIENGVLKGYMVDRLNARRMDHEITGSSRRQSYKYAPTSRMTNTYILNGKDKFEDMIRSIEYGLYAKYLGGGSVNTATGEFNFAVEEAYIIKNGEIKEPVKGATLIGTGAEILNKIEMISDNFDSAEGMCGSVSGSIPAGLGQPALKVSEITVGGREEI